MTNVAYITKLKNVKHVEGTDNLNTAMCFDTQVIVSNDYYEGQKVVFFEEGLQLSPEFCEVNNLVRKNVDGKNVGGYLDPNKRRIDSITLRKIKSDGLALPIESLAPFCNIDDLMVGDSFSVLNGKEICCKYIPKHNTYRARGNGGKKSCKEAKEPKVLFFKEHVDTEVLDKHLDEFLNGDVVEITLKMHGTSGRTFYGKVQKERKQTFFQKLFHRPVKTDYVYGIATGTRRTILGEGRDEYRHVCTNMIVKDLTGIPALHKGEEIFYEIVGFEGPHGKPIMMEADNSLMKDKEFVKEYGPTTVFSYGCTQDHSYTDESPCCDIYVYRMTMTNEDGDVVEYSPDQCRLRCEQMGLKFVPVFETVQIPLDVNPGEWILNEAKKFYDGRDPVGKTHVREGVVCRIVNRNSFTAYKLKNHSFKVLSGIAIAQAEESGALDNMDQDRIEEL